MIYLLLTVFLNVLLSVFFKLFPKYGIDTLQAIVFNYIVCVITGSLFIGRFPVNASVLHQDWFPFAIMMGAGFISIFNLLGYCTRVDGITTATIANKLSLVIPVIFSVLLYSERAGGSKILGVVLAFPAVYLISRAENKEEKKNGHVLLPIVLFVGSGLLDTLVKFVERSYLQGAETQAVYTICVFATAAVLGISLLSYLRLTGRIELAWRHVLAGICLGVPNYFSIYFFIRMLNSGFLQSSAAIPVNNMAILLCSAIVALLFFKERLTRWRLAGLLLSVLSIIAIVLSDIYAGTI